MKYRFKIYEIRGKNELLVVSAGGNDKEVVEKEIAHYAMQYAQDGPIRIWRNYAA